MVKVKVTFEISATATTTKTDIIKESQQIAEVIKKTIEQLTETQKKATT